MTDSRDTMRWLRRGGALAIVVIGWVFIAWQNHFHITAPVVFVCLGYLAVVATVYNLWRTGTAVVDDAEGEGDSTWAKPVGALGELEREKRTLLKAIKEAEFDHQMGKLSQRDADEMIRGYRARAIEVIKEIDRLGLGAAGTVREQILREVRARVELDAKASRKTGAAGAERPEAKTSAKAGGKRGAQPAKGAARSADTAGEPQPSPADEAGAARAETAPGDRGDRGDHDGSPVEATPADEVARPARAAVPMPSDEELDADSTTAIEPRREDAAKEATP